MQLFLHYIFGENFIGSVKVPYVQYTWISINKTVTKVEKMVVLVKTFACYHQKFQLFQLSCKIVKEFETEI